MCYTNTSWGKKQLTRGQKVEEGYSVYGGIAKLQMYFVNVQNENLLRKNAGHQMTHGVKTC